MEAAALIDPGFWKQETPVLMGHEGHAPVGIPGLVYFRSSGSTGEPKWIGLSREALLASAAAVNAHLQVDRDSCWVLALPLHHVGGFGVVARVFQAGCRMAKFEDKWNAAAFAAWLEEIGGTHLSLVPTQVHDLVAAGLRAPASLKAIVVGGGILGETTGRAARELGWPVLASYGMTEAGSQIATQGLELLDRPYVTGPIGILTNWEVNTDEDGRILLRGDALFSGMLKSSEGEWKYEERSGEWFASSDLGKVENGQLQVLGRADTLVKILGELVDPVAVEAELLALAGAAPGSAVVVAVADPRAGNKLVLVHETVTPERPWAELLERYHASRPGYRRIQSLIEVREIPKSPLGKPRRAELSRFAAKRAI
ncbi:AMP-binding protein [Haloferula sp. BvORR071]|uniref:AMP-binding protein n=1 Tax=Haloferula sp. BvORR071 TaxID=1396141 RepID=UPI00054F0EE9|nr:AMP-binding protein [Haloferula sp. BvORR071]